MSTFDPAAFLNQSFEGQNDTEYPNVPEGEYIAVSDAITDKSFRTTSKGAVILDIKWNITDEDVKAATGLSNPSVRQSIFIDLTDSGTLDFSKGKNIQLGQLREALGMNKPGKPFSFAMLGGQVARVSVKTRAGDDGKIYADVKKVAAA